MNEAKDPNGLPTPAIKRPSSLRFSLIWLVPLLAGLAGLVLVVRTYLQTGPTIHIVFDSAEGLESGKTEVRFKDVVIGKVKAIALSKDASHVVVTVDLAKSATRLAVDDTRFWIVRPRIGIGGVSGINTLLSGAYIGIDVGSSGEAKRDFTGLEKPPPLTRDQKGRRFTLHTADAGSIAIGSPVYYRRVAVGQVVDAVLDDDGKRVTVQVFVEAPFDRFVTDKAHFWNAGGIDLSLSAAGLKVNTQSLATVLAGGIAFQPLDESDPGAPAAENAEFELFSEQAMALAAADGPSIKARLEFQQSTRGLAPGAEVNFKGIALGTVSSIQLAYAPASKDFYTTVVVELFPERLGAAYVTLSKLEKSGAEKNDSETPTRILQRFIDHGLHAQLRSGNLITGQLYVALFFKPGAGKPTALPGEGLIEIPTAPGNLEEIQAQIQSIVRKIDDIPFDEIGKNLRETLKNANSLLKQLDVELAPQAGQLLRDARQTIQSLDQNLASPDAALQQDARRTLEQVNRAAASLRALSDYLEQHPESLLRGKPAGSEPDARSGKNSGRK